MSSEGKLFSGQWVSSLILASGSPRRADLLQEAGIPFEKVSSAVSEHEPDNTRHMTTREMVLANALRKGRAVSSLHPGRVILAADTLVVYRNEILSKPADMVEAEAMLRKLSGRTHHVWTGVVLMRSDPYRLEAFAVQSDVTFHRLTVRVIRDYFKKVNPLDKAGAYGFQEYGEMIVRDVQGSRTNVIGLPMEALTEHLRRWMTF